MPPSRDALETSYTFCRQLSRRAGSNFYTGFLLLPKEKRRGMEALYAFMRCTDDLADQGPEGRDQGPGTGGQGPEVRGQGPGGRDQEPEISNLHISKSANQESLRGEAIAAWRAALQQALANSGSAVQLPPQLVELPPQHDLPLSALRPPPSALLPALADVVRRFQIPHEHLLAVIDGVEMDLTPRRYETFDELERYCEHVASAVGLACIHIWGFRGPEAFEPARQAGVALQLTNILRDLREDATAGRVYLPLADLRRCGCSEQELSAGTVNDAFLDLMRFEIERAKQFYRAAAGLWDWLEPDGRRIFGLMTATYRQLLAQIERRPADVLRRRVRLGHVTRLRLFARWLLFPHGSSTLK
jgi:phytoene synthase